MPAGRQIASSRSSATRFAGGAREQQAERLGVAARVAEVVARLALARQPPEHVGHRLAQHEEPQREPHDVGAHPRVVLVEGDARRHRQHVADRHALVAAADELGT
jgi:hypothetical protein